jgi:hypothetical protein
VTTDNNEVCPNCGAFVEQLDNETGWCDNCTPVRLRVREQDWWLAEYANELDIKLAEGLTIKEAVSAVADDVRPKCLSCGAQIKHGISKNYGKRGQTLFCTKNYECRKAQRRFKYYKYDLLMPHGVALARVIESLNAQAVA